MDVTLPSCHTHNPHHLSHELLSVPPQSLQGCCMLPAPLPPRHPTPFPQSKLGWVKRGQASGGICDPPQHSREPWLPFLRGISQHQARLGDGQDSGRACPSLWLLGTSRAQGFSGPLPPPPSASTSPKAPSCPSRLSLHLGAGVGEAKRDCLFYNLRKQAHEA